MRNYLISLCSAIVLFLFPSVTSSAQYYWTGAGANNAEGNKEWSDPNKWNLDGYSTGTIPATGPTLGSSAGPYDDVFLKNSGLSYLGGIGAGSYQRINNLTVDAGSNVIGGKYTSDNPDLRVDGDFTVAAGAQFFTGPWSPNRVDFYGAFTVGSGSVIGVNNNNSDSGYWNLANATSIALGGTTIRDMTNNWAWNAPRWDFGAALITLTNTNEFNIEQDVLSSPRATINSRGSLQQSISNTITGTGGITKTGAGTLILNNTTNDYSGATAINAGILLANGGGAIGDLSAVSLANAQSSANEGSVKATLSLGASETIGSLAGGGTTGGNVILNGYTLTVGGNNTSTTFAGVIAGSATGPTQGTRNNQGGTWSPSPYTPVGYLYAPEPALGAGNLVKIGSGTLELTAANLYTGGTTISAGTLTLTNASAAGSGTITLNDSATGTSNTTLNFNVGSGNLTNPITVANLGTGTVTINQGVAYSSLTGLITLNRPTTITGGGSDRVAVSGKITGNVGTLTFAGAPRVTLEQSAGNASDFTGNVVVSTGTLQLNTIYGLPSTANVTVNGGAIFRLLYNNAQSINGLNGNGRVSMYGLAGDNATLNVGANGGDGDFSGVITQEASTYALSLKKSGAGTQILRGANTYSGGTTISGGTLQIGDGGTTGVLPGDVIDNATLAFNRSDTVTYAGTISGTGRVTKAGASLLTLSGPNSYAGGTSINTGTIAVGNLTALGTGSVTVASGATLNVNGYNIANSITLNGGRAAGTPGTLSAPIILGAGGGILQGGTANYLNFAGKITGGTAGTTSLTARDGHVMLSNPENDFSGNVEVGAGTGYYLATTASEVIPNTASVNVTEYSSWKITGTSPLTETIAGLTNTGPNCRVYAESGNHTLAVGFGDVSSTFGGQLSEYLGKLSLQKIGNGTLTLTGTSNNYTGTTTVSGGTLLVGNTAALGTGAAIVNSGGTLDLVGYNIANPVTLNGGTLAVGNGGPGSFSAQITLNNVAGNRINAYGNYQVLTGPITGPGGFTLGGTNTPGVALANPANDFQGDVTVGGGAYLGLWTNEVIPDTANVILNGYFRFEGNNRTETIAGLSGGGSMFEISSGGVATLRVGAGDATSTYSGGIGSSGHAAIRLEKIGAGTLTLTGSRIYTGGTAVDGGTLLVNNTSGSGTGTGTVDVNPGGRLGGFGFISGPVNVLGTIAPGNSVDTLSTGSETWGGGGIYHWEINDRTGTAGQDPGWDLLDISGTLTVTATPSNRFKIDVDPLTALDFQVGDVFLIAQTAGGVVGFDAAAFDVNTSALSGFDHYLAITSDGANVYLGVVPEPSTLVLAALALLGLFGWRRNRVQAIERVGIL